MKFFLLSNDEDTLVGMRLAGIEGKLVTSRDELLSALEETVGCKNIGVVMISSCLAFEIEKELIDYKKNCDKLIVEIPDKNSGMRFDGITKYVRDAIGLSI